jgi:hypothetical protein
VICVGQFWIFTAIETNAWNKMSCSVYMFVLDLFKGLNSCTIGFEVMLKGSNNFHRFLHECMKLEH